MFNCMFSYDGCGLELRMDKKRAVNISLFEPYFIDLTKEGIS